MSERFKDKYNQGSGEQTSRKIKISVQKRANTKKDQIIRKLVQTLNIKTIPTKTTHENPYTYKIENYQNP